MRATAVKEKSVLVEAPALVQALSPQPREPAVRLAGLGKAYGTVHAVKGVSFEVPAGSTLTLLGPSGCGKTTTLRCIAGLETPTAGEISVAGRPVFDAAQRIAVPPERREIGMVFQSYAIWPHMTVAGNVGFPLEIKGLGRAQAREKVERILDLVGLGHLGERSASQLSGGQQQRVALARALVFEPRLVLFDEPLSNLDANLRDRMRTELQALQARLGFTAIYVTHDQQEALSLSDTVIVMKDGGIEQAGTPRQVFQSPATLFVAKFLGYSNLFSGEAAAASSDGRTVTVKVADGVALTGQWRGGVPFSGGRATIAFRGNQASVLPATSAGEGVAGIVEAASFLGTYVDYLVNAGGVRIKAEGSVHDAYGRGDRVQLAVRPTDCHVFPAEQPA